MSSVFLWNEKNLRLLLAFVNGSIYIPRGTAAALISYGRIVEPRFSSPAKRNAGEGTEKKIRGSFDEIGREARGRGLT